MSDAKTILLADDDSGIRTVLSQALLRKGFEVRATGNATTLWRWVADGEGDLVVTDVVLPDENIFEVLPRMRKVRPNLPIVVMSAKNTIMTAITAAERGAYEYLPKPFDLNELMAIVSRGLEQARASSGAHHGRPSGRSAERLPLVGTSPAMQDIYRVIARMTQTDLTVMVIGESGTGKELVARAIHDYGKRKHGPFVALNMAAIPRELTESELFGHEKGAFTGAGARHAGRFEQAQGGTLFLDEIGDMPMEAQTRLLRVLQEGEYSPVGSTRSIRTDARIVAATHRDLGHLIAQGLFREDLYFRLNVVPVRLPPLRERPGDVPELVQHFLEQAVRQGLPRRHVSKDGIDCLKRHGWPGNVRELENLIFRLVAVNPGDEIVAADIEAELAGASAQMQLSGTHKSTETSMALSDFLEQHLASYFASHGSDLPPDGLYHRILQDVEAPLITAALAATNGNQVRAAKLLGLNRNTLRTRIRDLGLEISQRSVNA